MIRDLWPDFSRDFTHKKDTKKGLRTRCFWVQVVDSIRKKEEERRERRLRQREREREREDGKKSGHTFQLLFHEPLLLFLHT